MVDKFNLKSTYNCVIGGEPTSPYARCIQRLAGAALIIIEGADDAEFYRWRYWEEVAAARASNNEAARARHLQLAELYRRKLRRDGQSVPGSSEEDPA